MKAGIAYDPETGRWLRSWPGSVNRHDVVFRAPEDDPTRGLPIGDGESGCLLWTEGTKLRFVVNRCDLYDYQGADPFENWSAQREEKNTSLRQAAQGEIDFGVPAFDLIYQKDYEARMSLADGSACFRAETPFSRVSLRAFYEAESHVLVISGKALGEEPIRPRTLVTRWGSRTFAHWYSQVRRDPSAGLEGTEAEAVGGRALIIQKLHGLTFCVAAEMSGEDAKARRVNRHGCELEAGSEFALYLAVGAAMDEEGARKEANARLDAALREGEDALFIRHGASWRAFWEKGFVDIEDDYMGNLWHLALYYAQSSLRGAMPGHFCQGLWGFQHDFVPWNFIFHYNTQHMHWPLHAAGHAELMEPYLNFRASQLPNAMALARRQGMEGALYTDVAAADGAFDTETTHNLTPGPQIAAMLFEHYEFTGDETFLREKAWPVIRETARMYAGELKKGEDGKYHIPAAQAYEGSYLMEDPVTDLAMARAALPLVERTCRILGIQDPLAAECRKITENLAPFTFLPLEDDETERRDGEIVLSGGVGAGEKAAGAGQVLSAGRYIPEDRPEYAAYEDSGYWKNVPAGTALRQTFTTKKRKHYYGFPDVEMAPIFPANLVGLSQRGTELFDALTNQVRLHGIGRTAEKVDLRYRDEPACMGWCLEPIMLARMGLAKELKETLAENARMWQFYPNGLGHYGPHEDMLAESNLRFKTRQVRDADRAGERFTFPAWPFRHFDFEPLPIAAAAVNEMLMQSFEGRVRLFPACEGKAGFRLEARGGLTVDAQRDERGALFVSLSARRDARARLVDPWKGKAIMRIYPGGEEREMISKQDGADRVYEFDLKAGQRAFLTRPGTEIECRAAEYRRNENWKTIGRASLGNDKMY